MRNFIFKTWGCILLFVLPVSMFAQTKLVTGTVTSTRNEPIPFATVTQVGTKNGVSANETGQFSIKVNGSNVSLRISAAGYTAQEIALTAATVYDVQLKDANTLQDVVVTTAFGFKQKKKSLGYNVQELSAAQLDKGKENNIINSLQGKVSGVIITPTGGAPGAGTDILIRGMSSLNPAANNQPLVVIDGMPINNSTLPASVIPSAGSNGNQARSNDQFAFANRALDINPDDIESISVLKGAGATALYGLQAANGVLIITTKKGSSGKMNVSFNSSVSFDFVTKYPEIQTKYNVGANGRLPVNADGSLGLLFQSMGAPRQDSDPLFNNFKNVFTTGKRINNSLTLQGGNSKATYYTSFAALNQDGILDFTKFNRYTFKMSGSYQASPKLSISSSASMVSSKNIAPSAGDKGVMTALSYHTPSLDVRDYIYPDGSMKVYSPTIIDNPLYVARFSQMVSNLSRFFGNVGFNYAITPKLKFDYKLGGDFYSDNRTRVVPGPRFPGDNTTFDMAIANGGFMVEDRVTFRNITSNAIVSYQNKINDDIDYTLTGGNTSEVTYIDNVNTRGERFALPGFYDLSNTATLFSFRSTSRRRYTGIFASAKFGYKNAVYLELSGRNDWSSTLPKENNSFFYPSASLSYVFTDLHNISSDILSYGKLRLSYAGVGKDAPVYSVGSYFNSVSGFPFLNNSGASIPGFVRSSSYGDPQLRPEKQQSFEIGGEFRLLKNKVGFDVSYYNSKNIDQIIPIPISTTSGYSRFVTNAGSIQNSGLELEMNATPIQRKNFKWNVVLNWFRNRSKVVAIKEGISEINYYDEGRVTNKLVVGGSAGDLYATAYRRDADGNLLIKADGFIDVTPTFVKVGNGLPDWLGSINNTISYKNISLSFLLEYKKGGDMFDVTMRNSIRNGVLKITENRYQQVIFRGVKIADGKPNDIPVVLDHNYYRNTNFFNNIGDVIVQDASWLRLRNVVLGYDLPKKLTSKLKWIKGANIGVTASNFLLWTPYSGYDPGSTAFSAGYNVYGFTGSNIPNFSSVIVNLNVTF